MLRAVVVEACREMSNANSKPLTSQIYQDQAFSDPGLLTVFKSRELGVVTFQAGGTAR